MTSQQAFWSSHNRPASIVDPASIALHTNVTPHPHLSDFKSTYLGPSGTLREWPQQSSPDQRLLPLQYGIECETTLAFHQSAIRFYRQGDRTDRRIVKRLRPKHRQKLNNAQRTDVLSRATRPDKYQGWAVLSDLDDPLFDDEQVRRFMHSIKLPMDEETLSKKRQRYPIDFCADDHVPVLRTWWSEPLEIVEDLFERKRKQAEQAVGSLLPQQVEIRSNWRKHPQKNGGKDEPYKNWTVTNDQTLVSAPRKMLHSILQSQGIAESEAESNEWDTSGIEIVSRVMDVGDPNGFAEIEWVMDAFADKAEPCFAFQSVFSALQVHVGFDETLFAERERRSGKTGQHASRLTLNDDNNIPNVQDMVRPSHELMHLLQHLCYIILSFEHIYARFVPPHRRGLAGSLSAGDTRSNRAHFFTKLREQHPTTSSSGDRPRTLDVWTTVFDPSLELPQLLDLMQDSRAFMVNFSNLAHACENSNTADHSIRTVEFRFHEGTNDPTQIKMFVMLCVALVRAADRMAKTDRLYNTSGHGNGLHSGRQLAFFQRGDPFAEATKYKLQNFVAADFVAEAQKVNTLGDFFELLDLDEMQRAYWRARFEWFDEQEEMETQRAWVEEYPDDDDDDDDDDGGVGGGKVGDLGFVPEPPGPALEVVDSAAAAGVGGEFERGSAGGEEMGLPEGEGDEMTEEELDRIEAELVREREAEAEAAGF